MCSWWTAVLSSFTADEKSVRQYLTLSDCTPWHVSRNCLRIRFCVSHNRPQKTPAKSFLSAVLRLVIWISTTRLSSLCQTPTPRTSTVGNTILIFLCCHFSRPQSTLPVPPYSILQMKQDSLQFISDCFKSILWLPLILWLTEDFLRKRSWIFLVLCVCVALALLN